MRDINGLLQASQEYLSARAKLLSSLQLDDKQFDNEKVDPLTLVSEILVAMLFRGNLAIRRDQKGFDVETPEGQRIQVKYVLNKDEQHFLKRGEGWALYSVVLFRDGQVHMVVAFPNKDLTEVYQAFTHHNNSCPDPSGGFNLTKTRFTQMSKEKERFGQLGLQIWSNEDLHSWRSSLLLL